MEFVFLGARIMKPNTSCLFFPLFVLTLTPGRCQAQQFYSYNGDIQFGVTIRDADIAKAPHWNADAENPPLSPRKALKLANVVKERLVKNDESYKWHLHSIQLTPTDERQEDWFWMVWYEATYLKGDSRGLSPNLRLAVLMDGTVPEPTVKKR
jgi:hypothetical protein